MPRLLELGLPIDFGRWTRSVVRLRVRDDPTSRLKDCKDRSIEKDDENTTRRYRKLAPKNCFSYIPEAKVTIFSVFLVRTDCYIKFVFNKVDPE